MRNFQDNIYTFIGFLIGNGIGQYFFAQSLAEGVFKTIVISIIATLLSSVFHYLLNRGYEERQEQKNQEQIAAQNQLKAEDLEFNNYPVKAAKKTRTKKAKKKDLNDML